MKKISFLISLGFGVLLMPHLSHATVVWNTMPTVATSTSLDLGSGYNSANVDQAALANVSIGTQLYFEWWAESMSYPTNNMLSHFYAYSPVSSDFCQAGCYFSMPLSNFANPADHYATGTFSVDTNYTGITAGVSKIGFQNTHPGGGQYLVGGDNSGSGGSFQPWLCVTTDPSLSDCGGGPSGPAIVWSRPINGTTTEAPVSPFDFALSGLATGTTYDVGVYYGPQSSTAVYYDETGQANFLFTSTNVSVYPSVSIGGFTTATWLANAYLFNASGTVVASSGISFVVSPLGSSTSTIYGSSSFPIVYPPGYLASTSSPFATSTCSWGDVVCGIGNIFDNVMNWCFGINQSEIDKVAGFKVAEQPPFDAIPKIQADFASVGTSTSALASSSISANLGHGSFSLTFFDPDQAKRLMGPSAIALIRSLLLAGLVVLMVLGFYLEIKKIFKPHA